MIARLATCNLAVGDNEINTLNFLTFPASSLLLLGKSYWITESRDPVDAVHLGQPPVAKVRLETGGGGCPGENQSDSAKVRG